MNANQTEPSSDNRKQSATQVHQEQEKNYICNAPRQMNARDILDSRHEYHCRQANFYHTLSQMLPMVMTDQQNKALIEILSRTSL